MKATLSVVRAYGSTTRWGRLPREIPAGSPIVLGNYPKGWTTSIHFGVPPAWVLKGERIRQVYARTVLRGQFLPTQRNYDRQAIEAMIADESIGPIVEQWDHWLTIACDQVVNVPDSEWS
ncbi:MAG: hypothetical protein M3O64_01785, partial [Chloroflexota bacterium]|nr:hypothetical protein [Chloroflexota bacterium]